ncbi:MAG: FimV family protein [Proteobacteria bacterium]|nr:FimV family protein [Pseudomonadota bacterium]
MRATSVFTLSLVATALALPHAAHALGLGKLTVDSALGQPLSARIELTSATREELDSLTARIADPSIYSQNQLNYQGALARARVSVETNADGQAYLRVTSPQSVLEPYIDLLIEVNWSAGRVVRDYTLLLDPPGVAMPAPAPVAPVGAATRPARGAPAVASTPTAAPAVAPGEGYTVKRGDTLAKIAGETKPADTTLDQMLVALFKANESAFVGNNMNRLRAGAILTVPQAAEVAATPPADAHKTVMVQASDWRAYRDRVAASAPEAGGESSRTAQGQIGTAVREQTPAAAPGSDQLRVSRENRGKGASGAAEDAVARDQQLKEAQARISQLEKMLADSQHAAALKNSTMAQMQNQAEAAKGASSPSTPATTPPAPATPSAVTPPPAATTPPAAPTAPAATTTPAPAVTPPPAATTPPAETPPAATTSAPATPPPAATTPAPAATPAPAPKAVPKAVPKSPPKAEPSFFDELNDMIPWQAWAAALVLILALIGFLVARRRNKTTKFEDSIISGTDIKTNTVFGSTGGGVVNTGDNSLASDFSREGLGSIDTDEVDPIAEAEVYLAYGRDAQAEEILKDALKKDPQRQEIYLKLLEIHAQHNKPSAFETVAAELYAVCQGQGETWQKAVALGRQLDPNNPMFAEGSAPAATAQAAAAPDAELFTMGPDLTLPPKEIPGGGSIHLDDEITISPSSGARPKTPTDILAGADRAIEASAHRATESVARTADAATAHVAAAGESVAEKIEAARDKMDLDFRLDDMDKPAPMKPAPRVEAAVAAGVAAGAAATATAADRLARPAAAVELDKLDLSFDPDKATFEDPTPSVLDGQWHDAATKLDLAKAYQEMGDVEGAREILQEVLHEGDDQQKAEAQALIAKLG